MFQRYDFNILAGVQHCRQQCVVLVLRYFVKILAGSVSCCSPIPTFGAGSLANVYESARVMWLAISKLHGIVLQKSTSNEHHYRIMYSMVKSSNQFHGPEEHTVSYSWIV